MRLNPKLRIALPIILVTLTIAVFIWFFATHPAIRHALRATDPWILLLVAALYGVFVISLAWVYQLTLRLCGKRLPLRENFLLTCYSTIANFFGPLQSGPGVRAAYLKQKHQVKLRDYTAATFIYYGIYAVISALFLFLGSQFWWLAVPAAILVGALSYFVVQMVFKRGLKKGSAVKLDLNPRLLGLLIAATVFQLATQALIYFVELRAVHAHESIRQAVTYGGAANFALFVSLTPGAIGFREAFLEFSRRLHHISTTSILAASVIDRAVFVAFLGLLFLMVLGLHARDRFRAYS